MGRLDDLNKLKQMLVWRRKTGNKVFKGTFRDSKTLQAEKWMREKPYKTILDKTHEA